MPGLDDLRDTLIAFATLGLLFVPLERAFPRHRQPIARAGFATDLAFFLGQYLAWGVPVVAVLYWTHASAQRLPLDGLRAAFGALPLGVQLVAGILVSDLCVYWAHRASHAIPVLWRFHRAHHTAERLDWLAAHREHPFDNLYTRFVENVPLILLGFPLHVLAGFAVFRGLWALYIHSNVALGPGPLRYVLGAPRLHHWHHAPEAGGRVNFANLNPLMDLAFGTYHDPGRDPGAYGPGDAEPPRGFVGQIVAPLVPARLLARLGRRRQRGAVHTASPTAIRRYHGMSKRPGAISSSTVLPRDAAR